MLPGLVNTSVKILWAPVFVIVQEYVFPLAVLLPTEMPPVVEETVRLSLLDLRLRVIDAAPPVGMPLTVQVSPALRSSSGLSPPANSSL